MRRPSGFHWTTKPPLGSRLNLAHPLCQSLTACYLLNEGGGNKAFDLTGQYNATATTGTWGADGAGAVANIAATASHAFSTAPLSIGAVPVSLACWATSSVSSPNSLYLGGLSGSAFTFRSNGLFKMCVYYNATIFALDSFVIDTSPHFWVATNSGNTNGLVLYRDGIAVGSGTKSLTALSGNLQIGGGGSWNGTVSQQMLWVGRALSAADVAQLYADRYAMIAPPGYRR